MPSGWPRRTGSARSRHGSGIGDGTTVVIYDDTQGLYAARVWWSLQAYGLQQVRILDGGFPAWEAENRPISRGLSDGIELPVVPFTPRGPNRMHLTTSDVRAMLGAPSVALLDARAPAEYRGFEGNTRRLGHIPGAVNVPVGNMHESGSQRLRSGDELRSLLHCGERQPRPSDGGLRRIRCGRGEAGPRADAARTRRRRRVRRGLGRMGEPPGPAGRPVRTGRVGGLASSRSAPWAAAMPAGHRSRARRDLRRAWRARARRARRWRPGSWRPGPGLRDRPTGRR